MYDFSTELISRYLDGDVSTAERAQVEALLASNADARSFYEELRGLSSSFQLLPSVKSPPDLAETVLLQIERQQPAKKPTKKILDTRQPIVAPQATANREVPSRRWAWNSHSLPNAIAAAAVLLAAVTYMLAGPFDRQQNGEVVQLIEAEDSSLRRQESDRGFKQDDRDQLGDELDAIEGKAWRDVENSDDATPPIFADQQQTQLDRNTRSAIAPRQADNADRGEANKHIEQKSADSELRDATGNRGASFGGGAEPPPNTQPRRNVGGNRDADGKRESRGGRGAPPAANSAEFLVPPVGDDEPKDKAPAENALFGASLLANQNEFFGLAADPQSLAIVEVHVAEAAWHSEAFRDLLEQQEIVWADPTKNQALLRAGEAEGPDAENAVDGIDARGQGSNDLGRQIKERSRISRGMAEDDEKSSELEARLRDEEEVQLVYVEAEPAQLLQVLSVLQADQPARSTYGGLSMSKQNGRYEMETRAHAAYAPEVGTMYAQLGQQIFDYYFRSAQTAETETLDRDTEVVAGGGGGGQGPPPARGDELQTNSANQASDDSQGTNQQLAGADSSNAKIDGATRGGVQGPDTAGSAISSSPQGSYYRRLDPATISQFWLSERMAQLSQDPSIRSLAAAQSGGAQSGTAQPGVVQSGDVGQVDGSIEPPQRPTGRGRATDEGLQPANNVELQFAPQSRSRILFVLRKQPDERPIRAPDPGQR